MGDEKDLQSIVSDNLTAYRKAAGLTQLELAQKINYSDKAVSKWERGEGVPDIFILKQIADIYGITVNELLIRRKLAPRPRRAIRRIIITALSVLLVWVIATAVYVLISLFQVAAPKLWLIFICAIPVSAIIVLVFTKMWATRRYRLIPVSVLIWSLATALFLMVTVHNNWLFFIAAAPVQVLACVWFLRK